MTESYEFTRLIVSVGQHQEVQVFYENVWRTAVIISSLHPVDQVTWELLSPSILFFLADWVQYDRMGYRVKLNIGGRTVELSFLQEEVRPLASDIHYT